MNTAEKYDWVVWHPKLNKVGETSGVTIEYTPMMVNPSDDRVSDVHTENTKLVWWIEAMVYEWSGSEGEYVGYHDWDLDCGGNTAEEATNKLYKLVKGKYGHYENEN